MPRTGGIYTLPSIYHAESGTTIMPQQHNIPFEDVAQALTGSLPRDGSAPMNGNLPMNGRKVVGLANGTAADDAAAFGQVPVLSDYVRSMSNLSMVADRIIYSLNSTTAAMAVLTPFMRLSLAATDAASARAYFDAASTAVATPSLNGLMSSADKTKMDGIAAGAQVNVPTNLGASVFANTVSVTSSTGTNATIPRATSTEAGVMGAADKSKLDGIADGAQVNVPTNLTYTSAASNGLVNSSTGSSATIPAATVAIAGLMTSADKTKLNGIADGAQVNVPTNLGTNLFANNLSITSSTGTNTLVPRATTTEAGVMAAPDKVKLDGIAAGAQVNAAIATQAQAEGGSNDTATMTPLRVEQHMLANALGWGQTWQDMSSSRSAGTSVRNTTGRPIQVSLSLENGDDHTFQVSVNNSTWVTVAANTRDVGGTRPLTCTVNIPDTHYYRWSLAGPTGSQVIKAWSELR